jgi:hypothetical protein
LENSRGTEGSKKKFTEKMVCLELYRKSNNANGNQLGRNDSCSRMATGTLDQSKQHQAVRTKTRIKNLLAQENGMLGHGADSLLEDTTNQAAE